jgi:hypothetical protein
MGDEQKRSSRAQAGYRCPLCGSLGPFETHHKIPISEGGSDDPNNLILLCANCNAQISSPREIQFVRYLASLIKAHPKFSSVALEAPVGKEGRLRADILADRATDHGSQRIIIECKSLPVLEGPRLASIAEQLSRYARSTHGAQVVLAFPGRANDAALEDLAKRHIEVWDIDKISSLFGDQIAASDDPYFKPLLLNTRARASPQEELINELNSCLAGHEAWAEYQKLIGRILSDLFCPPLMRPLEEHSDASKANRRDFIFPNYASDGFWYFLRTRYAADYIVIDAKNGKGKVTKAHVLQMANYLKVHGVGLFGVILCRRGASPSTRVTIREQWLSHNKLVLVLDDHDLENMLLAKAAGGNPITVLSDRIQEFRLSM